ncbi:phage integrase family protein [Candidatus Marinimicrobia bacterium MT.SAG.3]|nr:phage integrase family protein [Candidatus Marinimicrobia bacterium MT.SAG.3]
MNWILTPDKFLTPEETKQLRKTCSEAATIAKSRGVQAPVRDALIIELALGSGLRVSEMANLKIEGLYLKRGQSSIHVKNGKGGKDRVVDIGSNLKKHIIEFLDYRSINSQYLFPSERGERMTRSGIQQVFKKWAKRARISAHYSIHSLRHTYATNLYKASGYNLRLVQRQLGHSSPTVTQVYADVMDTDVEEALKNLESDEE